MKTASILLAALVAAACDTAHDWDPIDAQEDPITRGPAAGAGVPFKSVVLIDLPREHADEPKACTGTKIGPKRFLTAAHCVADPDYPPLLEIGNEVQITNATTGAFDPQGRDKYKVTA